MSSLSSNWLWENVFELDDGLVHLDLQLHTVFSTGWEKRVNSVIVTADIVSGVFCSLDVHQRNVD